MADTELPVRHAAYQTQLSCDEGHADGQRAGGAVCTGSALLPSILPHETVVGEQRVPMCTASSDQMQQHACGQLPFALAEPEAPLVGVPSSKCSDEASGSLSSVPAGASGALPASAGNSFKKHCRFPCSASQRERRNDHFTLAHTLAASQLQNAVRSRVAAVQRGVKFHPWAANTDNVRRQRARQRWAHVLVRETELLRPPSIARAREYADSFLPRAADGRQYNAFALNVPFGRPRPRGAPFDLHVFDAMGDNIGLYMRFTRAAMVVCGLLSLLAIAPIMANLVGSRVWRWAEANQMVGVMSSITLQLFSMSSLINSKAGNRSAAAWIQAISDALVTLLLLAAFFYGRAHLRRFADIQSFPSPERFTARHFTLKVSGIANTDRPVTHSELRSFFEQWGEVVAIGLPRANRKLIQLLRARKRLLEAERIEQMQAALARMHGGARTTARRWPWWARWLERRLERPSRASRLHALTSEIRLLLSEPARLTGIAFVTFNEQRAAFACLHELGSTPLRSDEDAIPLLLSARFAEDPDSILWENLEISERERLLRGMAVSFALLVLCLVSTAAIVAVTNYSVVQGLDGKGTLQTTIWTTCIIIISNVTIFKLVDYFAKEVEVYPSADARETAMTAKMLFFQLLNSYAACLSFLWTAQYNTPAGLFDMSWYIAGGVTVVNILIGDTFVINLLVEGVRVTDSFLLRVFAAPRAKTQYEMNKLYAFENPLYLPFRMQLALKLILFALTFSSALPLLYPLSLLFFLIGWQSDCSNLLRRSHGVLVTSDRLVKFATLEMLPIAIMLHCVASVFFSHHKELEARSLVSGDAVYTFWYDAERTVGSAAVAVPFGVGVGAAALLSGTLVADAWRARAKEKLKAMMMRRLPHINSEAANALKQQLESAYTSLHGRVHGKSKEFGNRLASGLKHAHAHTQAHLSSITPKWAPRRLTASELKRDISRYAAIVPFRELYKYNAHMRLYLPPLTAALLTDVHTKTLAQSLRERMRAHQLENGEPGVRAPRRARVSNALRRSRVSGVEVPSPESRLNAVTSSSLEAGQACVTSLRYADGGAGIIQQL